MNDLLSEKLAIREVVENWVLYRDAGDWERFATVWHDDGWMTATWFQGPAKDFIEASRVLFKKSGSILHQLCGWTCDISGNRAISQVKMTINQRAPLDGVWIDVVCYLMPDALSKLEMKLKTELEPGKRIVSNKFTFPTLEMVKKDGNAILYTISPN